MLVCLNGIFIPHEDASVPINDAGFLFGDTLFETLKARGQKILLQDEHLTRLENSARLLNFPCQRQRIETALQQLSDALTAPASRIRLTLSRGPCQGLVFPESQASWFLLSATAMQETTETERQIGAKCVIAPNRRVNPLDHLPQMKRGNYADCLYAANYARQKNAREALFIDDKNNIQEGSTSNLFALINQGLITPPIDTSILAGVMRQQIINTATELGIPVTERNLNVTELADADEAFLSNSLIDILPITAIDNQPINRSDTWKILLKTLQVRIET